MHFLNCTIHLERLTQREMMSSAYTVFQVQILVMCVFTEALAMTTASCTDVTVDLDLPAPIVRLKSTTVLLLRAATERRVITLAVTTSAVAFRATKAVIASTTPTNVPRRRASTAQPATTWSARFVARAVPVRPERTAKRTSTTAVPASARTAALVLTESMDFDVSVGRVLWGRDVKMT